MWEQWLSVPTHLRMVILTKAAIRVQAATSSHPDTNKHRSALPERAGHFSDLEIFHEKE